jgi:WD40 repeat protein/serine/threonine protein kinase/uncharacterized membrane protein
MVDELVSHVETCAACQSTLEEISNSSDPLAASLRHQGEIPFSQEPALQKALEFVQEIGLEASRSPAAMPPGKLPAQLKAIRDYEILEKLGEGGMGAVYKARHNRLKKIVAIKVLPADRMEDPHAVARFEREMEAVGKLEHPNIVRAMDAGEADGTHFLVMEYVAGSDLSHLVRQHGRLPIADACELIRQAALGLQSAHEHGLVHRDIKPSNLILSTSGTLKVLDLGLALLGGEAGGGRELTTTGQMMGTLDYMAPEQGSSSHKVDIRADIYSLGATLYKLLTGQAPFGGEKYSTPVQKMMALATATPAAVDSLRPDVPPELAAIVTKMLAREPNSRYSTPSEVAQSLQPFAQVNRVSQLLVETSSGTQETAAPRSSSTEKHLSNSITGTQEGKTPFQAGQEPTLPPIKALSPNTSTPAPRPLLARLGETAYLPFAAAAVALLLAVGGVYYGITILIKNKEGKVIAQMEVEDGDSADVLKDGKTIAKVTSPGAALLAPVSNKASTGNPVASKPAPRSIFDALRREDIPPYELAVAGDGDPAKAPAEIVAIIGDSRMRHWSAVGVVAFVGNDKLASAGPDGAVRIWNVKSGKQEQVLPHPGGIWSLHVSADGQRLATTVYPELRGRVWSLKSGEVEGEFFGSGYANLSTDWSRLVAFQPNGSPDASLVDPKTGEQQRIFAGHAAPLVAVVLSPKGDLLATQGQDKVVKVWNVATGEVLKTFECGPVAHGYGVAFSPNGKLLATTAEAGVSIWEIDSGKNLFPEKFRMPGQNGGLSFSPDGNQLVHWSGGALRLFDLRTQELRWAAGTGTVNAINSTSFSPDSRLIASGSHAGDVRLWNVESGGELRLGTGHRWENSFMDVSATGVVAIGDGFSARLWDAASRKLLHTLDPGETDLASIVFNPDGSLLATGLGSGKKQYQVMLWDVNQGQLKSVLGGHTNRIESAAFAPRGHVLATGDNHGLVNVWDLSPGANLIPAEGLKPVANLEFQRPVRALAFSPLADLLAVGGQAVSLWNWKERKQVWSESGELQDIWSLAFDPGGKLLASAGHDSNGSSARLWDVSVGEEFRRFKDPSYMVWSVSISPDGRLLACSNSSGEVQIWDTTGTVGTSALKARFPIGHFGHIKRAKFTPDGRHLVTLNGNGTVYVLRLPAALTGGLTAPTGAADPDRRATEWVLSVGGPMEIIIDENGQERQARSVDDLPPGAFELTGVALGRNPNVSDAALARFKDCKNITQLHLDYSQVTDAGLVHFKHCKNLVGLTLGATKVSDAGLAHFKDCQNLTQLYLGETQVSDAGLAYFKSCKNLTRLDLHGLRAVSDEGLAHFKDCQNLTGLSLSETQESDAGLAHFKSCKNITYIDLYDAQGVSDRGLSYFKDCKNLTVLHLGKTQVSDTGLAHFKDCTNISVLLLNTTQVSDAGLATWI